MVSKGVFSIKGMGLFGIACHIIYWMLIYVDDIRSIMIYQVDNYWMIQKKGYNLFFLALPENRGIWSPIHTTGSSKSKSETAPSKCSMVLVPLEIRIAVKHIFKLLQIQESKIEAKKMATLEDEPPAEANMFGFHVGCRLFMCLSKDGCRSAREIHQCFSSAS